MTPRDAEGPRWETLPAVSIVAPNEKDAILLLNHTQVNGASEGAEAMSEAKHPDLGTVDARVRESVDQAGKNGGLPFLVMEDQAPSEKEPAPHRRPREPFRAVGLLTRVCRILDPRLRGKARWSNEVPLP